MTVVRVLVAVALSLLPALAAAHDVAGGCPCPGWCQECYFDESGEVIAHFEIRKCRGQDQKQERRQNRRRCRHSRSPHERPRHCTDCRSWPGLTKIDCPKVDQVCQERE